MEDWQRRIFVRLLGLLVLGVIAVGQWIGWENTIPLLFVLVMLYAVARSESNSTKPRYGWRKQK